MVSHIVIDMQASLLNKSAKLALEKFLLFYIFIISDLLISNTYSNTYAYFNEMIYYLLPLMDFSII